MKQPQDEVGSARKSLPMRKARKATIHKKPDALKKTAERKNVLKKGSDLDLVKAFGEK